MSYWGDLLQQLKMVVNWPLCQLVRERICLRTYKRQEKRWCACVTTLQPLLCMRNLGVVSQTLFENRPNQKPFMQDLWARCHLKANNLLKSFPIFLLQNLIQSFCVAETLEETKILLGLWEILQIREQVQLPSVWLCWNWVVSLILNVYCTLWQKISVVLTLI